MSVLDHALPTTTTTTTTTTTAPAELGRVARTLAAQPELWRPLLHVDPVARWYTRLTRTDAWEAWLLTWVPGQRTGLHDHGASAGAFTVLDGEVEELTPHPSRGLVPRRFGAGEVRSFGRDHVHEVVGTGDRPAATLHVYGPHLSRMNRYDLDGTGRLQLTAGEIAGRDW